MLTSGKVIYDTTKKNFTPIKTPEKPLNSRKKYSEKC